MAELPLDAVSVLENFVSEGGGLIWFVGPSIQPAFYNDKLFNEGKGLFPAPLEMAPRDLPARETNTIVDMQVSDHPLFSVFAGQDNPLIEAVTISKYFPLSQKWCKQRQKNASGVNVIATLRNQAPLHRRTPFWQRPYYHLPDVSRTNRDQRRRTVELLGT